MAYNIPPAPPLNMTPEMLQQIISQAAAPTAGPRSGGQPPQPAGGSVSPGFQNFPNYNMPSFPFQGPLQQLAGSMQPPQGLPQYGRWGGMPSNAQVPQWAPPSGGQAPPPGYGGGVAGGGAPWQPSPGNSDPGFGAAPSSAAFSNLTDADKAYLYKMQQQYRQDMRSQPGAHQLYFDLFGGQANPTQINSLINDTGLNSSILPGFNVNSYDGPLKQMYANLVQQGGGTVNPYGTAGAGSTYRPSTPTGGMVDFRQYFGPGGPGYAGG